MSWQATAWAKATRDHRSHGEKLILFILADYAHPETWIAWPNIVTIAHDAEMSERNVKRCLHSLEERTFILRLRRGNQYITSEYLLNGPDVDFTSYLPTSVSVGNQMSPTQEEASHVGEGDISNGEGDIPSTTTKEGVTKSRQAEEPKEPPQWWRILARDRRWPREYAADWGDTVSEQYGERIDLDAEAFKAVTWLGTTTKGLSRKPRGMKTFWLNWLGRTTKDIKKAPVSSRVRPNTVEELRKAKARTDGAN